MNKPVIAGIDILSVLFVSFMTIPPVYANSAATAKGCFVFTYNGKIIGKVLCNPKANDLETVFKGSCTLQFYYNGKPDGSSQPCPKGANDVEAFWGKTPTGVIAITKCVWTENGKPIGTCTVPTNPYPNQFKFVTVAIAYVQWTYNGKVIGTVKAPSHANDIEFKIK